MVSANLTAPGASHTKDATQSKAGFHLNLLTAPLPSQVLRLRGCLGLRACSKFL